MVISWMVVSIFVEVFSMCIDTMLMCYIKDMEENTTPIYADDSLQSFIQSHGKLDKVPEVYQSSNRSIHPEENITRVTML